MIYFSLLTPTKSAAKKAILGFFWIAVAAQFCVAQQRDERIQLWIDRTVKTTGQIATASNQPQFGKEYSLAMAALALGRVGCVREALELFDRAGFEDNSEDRQKGLLALADGLSTGDFVGEAIEIADLIKNEYMRGSSFSLIAIRQSQRGDFEDAESLVNRIPNQVYRDRAINQICSEYSKIGKFGDAIRLSQEINDPNVLSKLKMQIERERMRPSILDSGYVTFKIDEARNGLLRSATESELEFLNHYYLSQVAFEKDSQLLFESELKAARLIAEQMEGNDAALLLLGRLTHKAGKKDDAKSLFFLLFRNYAEETSENPFDFNKMMFGAEKDSDARIVADCMTDEESRKTIESLLKLKSATLIAAPLFGAVVGRKNPSWADELYENTADLELKAALACNCLLELAK
jgi:hypothetical protein